MRFMSRWRIRPEEYSAVAFLPFEASSKSDILAIESVSPSQRAWCCPLKFKPGSKLKSDKRPPSRQMIVPFVPEILYTALVRREDTR